jgi:hypothetical protein
MEWGTRSFQERPWSGIQANFRQFADRYEQFRHMAAIAGSVIARGGAGCSPTSGYQAPSLPESDPLTLIGAF